MNCPICNIELIKYNDTFSCPKNITIKQGVDVFKPSHFIITGFGKSTEETYVAHVNYDYVIYQNTYRIMCYNSGFLTKTINTYNITLDSKLESTIEKIINNQIFT